MNKYNGFYQELYELTKDDALVTQIHNLYWSDTFNMPKHLYNSDYVVQLVISEKDISVRKEISKKHGYPYNTISKKIKRDIN